MMYKKLKFRQQRKVNLGKRKYCVTGGPTCFVAMEALPDDADYREHRNRTSGLQISLTHLLFLQEQQPAGTVNKQEATWLLWTGREFRRRRLMFSPPDSLRLCVWCVYVRARGRVKDKIRHLISQPVLARWNIWKIQVIVSLSFHKHHCVTNVCNLNPKCPGITDEATAGQLCSGATRNGLPLFKYTDLKTRSSRQAGSNQYTRKKTSLYKPVSTVSIATQGFLVVRGVTLAVFCGV